MRISLFLPSLDGGGAERVFVTLAGGLAALGHPVELIVGTADGPYRGEVDPRVGVVDLGASRVTAALLPLRTYLRKRRPDILLSTLNHANVVALAARALARVPTRIVLREANVRGAGVSVRARLVVVGSQIGYRYADALVAISEDVATELRALPGVSAERVHLIGNPVLGSDLYVRAEEPLVHPWFGPGAPPVVLGVGRLSAQKDFRTLLHAFARLDSNTRLLILGEGPERERLEAEAKALGVASRVDLPGFMANPFSFMQNAAVLAMTSRWEGLPNVLLQAAALGTPVVATDSTSGVREALAEHSRHWLVPVGEVEAVEVALRKALALPPGHSRLRAPVARYTVTGVVGQYDGLLRALN